MTDDEKMDQLLRQAMANDPPQLSLAFDARVRKHLRPRRLTPLGRLTIGAYIVIASVATVVLMRDLSIVSVVAAAVLSGAIAAAASAYGRSICAES
jgi:hypothetical protein